MSDYLIYAILDPDTNLPKYVGSTAKGQKRLKEHLRPCRIRMNTPKAKWIKSCIDRGFKPSVIVLQDYGETVDQRFELEKAWTQSFRLKGASLLNLFDGTSHTSKTREWVIKSNSGRSLSKKSRLKMGRSNSRYVFDMQDGSTIYGAINLSKKIGVKYTTIVYRIGSGKALEGVKNVRYNF